MNYTIKAHPTRYRHTLFRSRLEARWAAMFDLIGWEWEYEPLDLNGWTPDFRVVFGCDHSDCIPEHALLVEVKPYYSIADFADHPCMNHMWLCEPLACSSAAFGANPHITHWEMSHGSGGGNYSLEVWGTQDLDNHWAEAGLRTRYKR